MSAVADRGHFALLLCVGLVSACGDDHPAYELEFGGGDAVIAQSSEEPADLATMQMSVEVAPTVEHTESWITLGASERFPEGLLRLYEPAGSSRFVYDERRPVLAVPARLVGDRVAVRSEETTLQLVGQVSNLELELLCDESVVFVPRLVVWDREPEGPGEREFDFDFARNVRVTAVTDVECL